MAKIPPVQHNKANLHRQDLRSPLARKAVLDLIA